MDKQKFKQGYTLIEVLLSIMIISVIYSTLSFSSKNSVFFSLYMDYLKQKLVFCQSQAILNQEKVKINFSDNLLRINDDTEELKVRCKGSYHYLPNGNVSSAITIPCTYKNLEKALVIQLGSGRIYVK